MTHKLPLAQGKGWGEDMEYNNNLVSYPLIPAFSRGGRGDLFVP